MANPVQVKEETPCKLCENNLGRSYELIIKCSVVNHGVLESSKYCKFDSFKRKKL